MLNETVLGVETTYDPLMHLNRREVGRVAVLDLSGRLLSTDGASALAEAVNEMVDSGHTDIVLNLSKVDYLDSGALGEIVASHLAARKAGGAMKLAQATVRTNDLLQATRLVSVLEVFDTEEQALASFDERTTLGLVPEVA